MAHLCPNFKPQHVYSNMTSFFPMLSLRLRIGESTLGPKCRSYEVNLHALDCSPYVARFTSGFIWGFTEYALVKPSKI